MKRTKIFTHLKFGKMTIITNPRCCYMDTDNEYHFKI